MAEQSRIGALGIDPSGVTDEQRALLDGLSQEEMAVLASVKQRFDSTAGDVEGHLAGDTGSVFW
jgi:hypothetical protein